MTIRMPIPLNNMTALNAWKKQTNKQKCVFSFSTVSKKTLTQLNFTACSATLVSSFEHPMFCSQTQMTDS